ncbi:putative antitoxin YezG [Bacillus velezensis]|nr:putative antitoxin YezG [Bacillus velezensis]
MTLESNDQFQLDYNDDDILASELDGYQRIALWEYKTLGILLEDEEDQEFLISHLNL